MTQTAEPRSVLPQGVNGASGGLWGAPIVETTQCPTGTAIVMSVKGGGAVWWTRMSLVVEFNMWSDAQWTQNWHSYRAEERAALTSPRPQAISIVDGLPTG